MKTGASSKQIEPVAKSTDKQDEPSSYKAARGGSANSSAETRHNPFKSYASVSNDKLQKYKIKSKFVSSFGDPDAKFLQNFRDWADEEKIPALHAKKTYQLYVWRKGNMEKN